MPTKALSVDGAVGGGGGTSTSSSTTSGAAAAAVATSIVTASSSGAGSVGGASSYLDERLTLVVDNTRFVVDPNIFTQYPNTMLGRMFTSGMEFVHANDRGEYDVAEGLSATVFRAILEYYRTGQIRCPPTVSVQELREACDYLLIPFGASTIKCQNLSKLSFLITPKLLLEHFILNGVLIPFRTFFFSFRGPLTRAKQRRRSPPI